MSTAKDQDEVHAILLNVKAEDGFTQMPMSTFFNITASFDIPIDILYFLEQKYSSIGESEVEEKRDAILEEMRQIRMRDQKVKEKKNQKGKHEEAKVTKERDNRAKSSKK